MLCNGGRYHGPGLKSSTQNAVGMMRMYLYLERANVFVSLFLISFQMNISHQMLEPSDAQEPCM